jgi:hypothetical protein
MGQNDEGAQQADDRGDNLEINTHLRLPLPCGHYTAGGLPAV